MMISKSEAIFMGKTTDILLRQTKTGKPMLTFTLTTFKQFENEYKPFYHSIVAYSKAAEILVKYLKSGSFLYCECDINKSFDTEKYQFVVKEFTFIGDMKNERA